jgi:uncharacterized protein (TIGR02246 family)
MKSLYLIVATLALTASLAAQPADEQAVRDMVESISGNWSKADAAGIADRWLPDGDMMVSSGDYAKGPADIQKWFAAQFAGVYKGTKMTQTVSSVRMLKADTAIVNGDWEISGIQMGGKMGSRKGKVTVVAVKDGGRWRVAAWRSMVPAKAGSTS